MPEQLTPQSEGSHVARPTDRSSSKLRDRRWSLIAGVAVLAIGSAIAAIALAIPEPRRSGSEGNPLRDFVLDVTPTEPYCRDLLVDRGTDRLVLRVGTYGQLGAGLNYVLRTESGRQFRGHVPKGFADMSDVSLPIPKSPTSENARLCLTSPGKVALVGMNFVPAIFLYGGGKRPLVTELGTIGERASLFRPSWVGPWVYYCIFGLMVVMPVVALILVRSFLW